MIIDGFGLLRQLPGGRHGAMMHGTDQATGTPVALKQMLGTDVATAERIRAEIDRLTSVSEPHLAGRRPPVDGPDGLWLVEDWVEGTSLAAVLASGAAVTRPQALGVIRGILLALAAAHAATVVHGELSPRSVLINTEGQPMLVGFAAHLADASVAAADGFAAPEALGGRALSPAADVFSAGAILNRMLAADAETLPLRPIVERATATDPVTRYPDAAAFLADLEPAAERAYGPTWWTTAGLSGIVASTAAATAAAAGTAGTTTAAAGSGGAIAGTLSAGDGVLAGASQITHGSGAIKTVVATGARNGKRVGLIIAGVAVVLVVVVVGAVALLRPGNNGPAAGGELAGSRPGSNTGSNTGSTSDPSGGPSSVPTPVKSPAPARTPKPPPQQGFTGTYSWESVVTNSTVSSIPVGKRYRAIWAAKTDCRGGTCRSTVSSSVGSKPFQLEPGRGGWHTDQTTKAQCVNLRTGKLAGFTVPLRHVRTLTPGAGGPRGIEKITGTERFQQLKNCKNQQGPRQDVRYKITISKIK